MGISLRKSGLMCGTAFATAALALTTATTGGAASSALIIGGISTPSMSDVIMAPLLGGAFKDQQRVSVNWPAQAGPMTGKGDLTLGASIAQGETNLNTQINSALGRLAKDAKGNYLPGEKVTVVGLSAGSLVVDEVLRDLAASSNAPGKDQITFVMVADSSRQKLIDDARYNSKFDYTYRPAPETKYDVIVVTGEYDGMADFPDRWWNTLAIMNAVAGSLFVHVPVMYADLSKVPAKNIDVDVNSQGGTTTHYLVPTEKLPLVRMFPSLASREAELKAKIDKGYSRNDVVTAKVASKSLVSAVPVALAAPAPVTATVVKPVAPVAPTATVSARVASAQPVAAAAAEVPSSASASLRAAKVDETDKTAKAEEPAKTVEATKPDSKPADDTAAGEDEAASDAAVADTKTADSNSNAAGAGGSDAKSTGDDQDGADADAAGAANDGASASSESSE
ncbi:hypothetical protein FHR72_005097 [Mycolicibacterium iranicum]|uniref:PE-PPE domain-containing protein n=1 Tax=Mycolicibacterium iranicum TaxID=912594 RepID=A0A839QDA3_MYCIR|nr:PE-PPE domain-containing protein [Mycolicibacterium iranicum]MBB2993587.1 hypothetical protein [Mycolicibacterium iranicum]